MKKNNSIYQVDLNKGIAKMLIILIYVSSILSFGCSKDEVSIKSEDPVKSIVPLIGGDYFVAPDGNDKNSGTTLESPWATWQKAFDTAGPGDTVYFRGGVYLVAKEAEAGNITMLKKSGTKENPICFFNYPGESPILDCSLIKPTTGYNTGLYFYDSDFLSFRGLTLRNVKEASIMPFHADGIMSYACTNMRFENMTVHTIGGPGIQHYSPGGADTSFYINCDVYDVCDSLRVGYEGGRADGYFLQVISGGHLYIEGCRAWGCSDDGFNLDGGGTMEVKSCWSWGNGKLKGDGSGFKLGPVGDCDGVSIYRIVTNCIAAFNQNLRDETAAGYTPNNNQGRTDYPRSRLYNNISYSNQFGFFLGNGSSSDHGSYDEVYHNNISYKDGKSYFTTKPNSYSYNTFGFSSVTDWVPTVIQVTDADFVSVNPRGLSDPRQADGSLPKLDFLRLAKSSKLKGAGTYVGMSQAPDIGIDWDYLDSK